ncbi:hypothetical protein Leryth_004889 [Lithospermum erythrorhizon]|uniref:Phospholipase n=1 Tax=Lithospermum erythrorhizon TaxID=34254 RepID=A0AAV3PTX0_LITER|nr:hypothetical protein Leryth_004889 [Lithospermum erythrorhizon]
MEVIYREENIRNSRGVEQFTCRWLPSSSSPKALVFLCHGYGMECSNFMKVVGVKLASDGYAVFGIDYEGHGQSTGSRCYIKKFDNLVNDCTEFFQSVCAQPEYKYKRRFLYGESMGGAVALLAHRKNPAFWHGAVLVAPMCKISEKVKPHPVVISILTKVEDVIPKWKIVPSKDIIDSAFKDPIKREEVRGNKFAYQAKPRLKTALEMLRTSMNLEASLSEVTIPFLLLHGEADIVTDPEVSRALYERASSKDKTFKLYPGMWHALTAGEPDDNVEIVFSDIISWLDKRCDASQNSTVHENAKTFIGMQDNLIAEAASLDMKTLNGKKKSKNLTSFGKNLFGWKGRRMHHHSAM